MGEYMGKLILKFNYIQIFIMYFAGKTDITRVWQVVGLCLAVLPFQKLAWELSLALYVAAGQMNNVMVFVVCGTLSFMLGAMICNVLYQ